MTIKEITSETDLKQYNQNKDKLHRVWQLEILGKILILERYGNFCGWKEIKLKKDKEEVYSLLIDRDERKEYFNNKLERSYQRDKFNFVKYVLTAVDSQKIPENLQPQLSKRHEIKYKRKLEEILA